MIVNEYVLICKNDHKVIVRVYYADKPLEFVWAECGDCREVFGKRVTLYEAHVTIPLPEL